MPDNVLTGYPLKTSPQNILHVVDGLGVGGAEMLVVTLLKNLKGYNLHLIVLGKPDTLVKEIPQSCSVTVLNFKNYRHIPSCLLFLRRYIKRNNIQTVHSHLYWSNITTRLATPRNIPLYNC